MSQKPKRESEENMGYDMGALLRLHLPRSQSPTLCSMASLDAVLTYNLIDDGVYKYDGPSSEALSRYGTK